MPTTVAQRKRLSTYEEPTTAPFVRATALTDCSLYWCGITQFPASFLEREWLLEFLRRLAGWLKQKEGLCEETFLQTKATLPDLMNTFLKRSSAYVPIAGMTLVPGTEPVRPPNFEEMRKAAEKASESRTTVDVRKWIADHAYLFLDKNAEAQRDDFFGHGGMFSLLLKPDPKPKKSLPALPRLFTSHPAYSATLHKQYEIGQAFQNDFLAESKRLFGEAFRDDPSFEGLPFILPLLTATGVMQAWPEIRQSWFKLFDGYWIESKQDQGMLLLFKDPDFDPHLHEILEAMRFDGYTYRSTQ